MSSKELKDNIRKLQIEINDRRMKIQQEMIERQKALINRRHLLEQKMKHGSINSKTPISKIQKSQKTKLIKKSAINKQVTSTKLRTANSLRRKLVTYVYKNRHDYSYKNRFYINDLKYVLINSGNTMALVSTQNESTKAPIASIDSLPLWIPYKGKKYVKSFSGKYNIQSNDRERTKHPEFCIYYTRNGYCQNLKCKYLHNPDHVALCPNILTSNHKCTKPHCHLSHTPTQFNAPSCRFFQEGECTNANCVYSHKLESDPSEPICREFAVNGYCDQGRECPYRHVLDCPDMDEYGYCTRGRSCHLNHSFKLDVKPEDVKQPVRNADNDEVASLDNNDSGYVTQDDTDSQFSNNQDFVQLN